MIQRFGKQEIEAVKNCITNASYLSGYTNKYLGGEEIQKFESEFAKFHNSKYGIAVNSGTTALFVAQKALNIKNKIKVAVPCITFTSTVSQVVANGGTPSFVDIDSSSYCMDYSFEKTSPKFSIPVHLLGHPCKFEMLKKMRDKKIFVIEDCAQSMGAKYKGKIVGSIGNCSIFSFQETKHITTLGEGGMILTSDKELADSCRKLRNHGEYYKDDKVPGFNFRMTETQAAFGRAQLRKLPQIIKTFQNNAEYIFKKLPNAILPPKVCQGVKHSFLILGCKFDQKEAKISRNVFLERLTKNRKKILGGEISSDIKGINFRPGKIISEGYRTVQYKIPLYKKYAPKIKCKRGEEFVRNSLFLDIHRWRSRDEINQELEIIKKTLQEFQ